MSESGGFSSDPFKDIVDKAVHDRHGFAGNTSVGMDLLQDLVDVNSITLLPPLLLLLISFGDIFLGLTGLLCSLSCGFGSHSKQFYDTTSKSSYEYVKKVCLKLPEYSSGQIFVVLRQSFFI